MHINFPLARHLAALVFAFGLPWAVNPQLSRPFSAAGLFFTLMYIRSDDTRPIRAASQRRRRNEFCDQCGYNLTGNVSGICPECGSAIAILEPVPRKRSQAAARVRPLFVLAMVLIGIFGFALFVPVKCGGHAERSRITAAKTDLSNLASALDQFQTSVGQFPTFTEGLNALLVDPTPGSNWVGPYVKQVPSDPWGTPYLYQSPGTRNPTSYDLTSAGPDGKVGTADDLVADPPLPASSPVREPSTP